MIRLEDHDRVSVLTLDRRERRNAFDQAQYLGLADALAAAGGDDEVRCAVVTGAGGCFSSGQDLDEMAAIARGELPGADGFTRLLEQLETFPKPLIAAVDGAAVTGGMELALAADARLGSERARFADTHTLVGLVPGWGMSTRLPALVGRSTATLLSLTGRFVRAEEAHRLGLLDELVPSEELEDRTLAVAGAIADADPTATAAMLGLYRARAADEDERARTREDELFARWVRELDGAEIGRRRQQVIERGRASAGPATGHGEGEQR
jgi:enoyl-CoA hydratase